MSYAGPAHRGKRALHMDPAASGFLRPSDLGRQPPSQPMPRPSRKGKSTAVVAAGIVIGLAVGAGVALLFAPNTGEETRHSIARRGKRFSRRGHDAWDDLRYELRRAMKNRPRWRGRREESSRRSDCP